MLGLGVFAWWNVIYQNVVVTWVERFAFHSTRRRAEAAVRRKLCSGCCEAECGSLEADEAFPFAMCYIRETFASELWKKKNRGWDHRVLFVCLFLNVRLLPLIVLLKLVVYIPVNCELQFSGSHCCAERHETWVSTRKGCKEQWNPEADLSAGSTTIGDTTRYPGSF